MATVRRRISSSWVPSYSCEERMRTSGAEDSRRYTSFLNAYLESKGAAPVNLDAFRTLPSS
jgi:hypothetical protein